MWYVERKLLQGAHECKRYLRPDYMGYHGPSDLMFPIPALSVRLHAKSAGGTPTKGNAIAVPRSRRGPLRWFPSPCHDRHRHRRAGVLVSSGWWFCPQLRLEASVRVLGRWGTALVIVPRLRNKAI